jgi:acetylglutamate kinase
MAAETAKSMTGKYNVTLIYAFEKPGVMKDPDDDSTLIPVITRSDFEKYQQDGTISGGMIPKIENALNTVDAGVEKVIITMATAIDGLHGTTIK